MSDQSYAESDVSMSPSQIFERLQVLRQLQLLQRGKLKKQQLQYQETTETSSSITEIVSHFSNSTSYNTFRSLLQSKYDTSDEGSPRANTTDLAPKVQEQDLIDGVSVLNLSQESEFIVNSPNSARSQSSVQCRHMNNQPQIECNSNAPLNKHTKLSTQNRISLDNMPILSPKKDFEALILEKLQSEKNTQKPESAKEGNIFELKNKKPFLRKGEGMSRFGLRKNDLVIQNTKSLPWRKRNFNNRTGITKSMDNERNMSEEYIKNKDIEIKITEPNTVHINTNMKKNESKNKGVEKSPEQNCKEKVNYISSTLDSDNLSNCNMHHNNKPEEEIKLPKGKHPLLANKGKTWASILTKEQNDFLIQLKQSDYYKNFASPAKSIQSEVSYDENYARLCIEREKAEQNMFDLLERKVSDCNLENSFFERFMRSSNLECSGESTPLVMQKCLANNPKLFNILPDLNRQRTDSATMEQQSCQSDCCSDTCSSVSTCCSCKTIKSVNNTNDSCIKDKLPKGVQKGQVNKGKCVNNTAEENYSCVNDNMKRVNQQKRPVHKQNTDSEIQCHNDTLSEDNDMKTNMADMNAKLVATSELLKDRLKELEDEINTFKKENSNLSKMREEIDLERHKFYEEKAAFEQKFNEDKILSEYYLAEKKDKLIKQKQMYEKYVREMRGRLNKKDRDEVANLKKDAEKLKEEIRLKDAKSTSIIARLRNQLKIMEKEKKELQDEIDKLKKENRRIHHSNDITRRLTNIKYLEEINKKLNNMANKDSKSDITRDPDVKYKSYEIERQSRSRRIEPNVKIRPRAKSVPNLKVTSRYAKYFSQKDSVSNVERHKNVHVERLASKPYESDHDDEKLDDINSDDNESIIDKTLSDNEIDNNLEKIYMETFRQTSPISNRSRNSNEGVSQSKPVAGNSDSFFLQRNSSSSKDSISPKNRSISPMLNPTSSNSSSKSPISILSNKCSQQSPLMKLNAFENTANVANNSNRSKSPVSVSNSSHRHTTIIHNENYRDKLLTVSPEPNINKNVSKTNLNPIEISKPDGSKELRFPNGNIKYISSDGKYSKFIYYNGDVKENFYNEGRIKYFYAETKTFHTTHPDGLEVLEFPDGQVEKRYKDGSSEIRLPNGSIRYHDPKNVHIREEWRFPDGTALTISADGEQHIVFSNGQVEVHAKDHKRREFPDGTIKLVYNDGTSETRYASGRIRIKDKHGNLIMDSAPD